MKATSGREELASALRKVLSVVSVRTTIPALNTVLIEASGSELALTTTDLEVSIRTAVNATVEEEGQATLPARRFGQLVNALPADEILLESADNDSIRISCGKSKFRLLGLDPNEFPVLSPVETSSRFALLAADFRKMLTKISYACSEDDPRQVLNGILLSIRNGVITTVATDGKRLAIVERNMDTGDLEDGDVILPAKLVKELERLLSDEGDLAIELSGSRAAFSFDGTQIVSKLVDGVFPNYRQVIPESFAAQAVIPREAFADVLARVSLVVSETSAYVRLALESGVMTVSAASQEYGEASEPLEVSYDGEPIDMQFNPMFLADPLRRLECDQLIFRFNDRYSPVEITGDEGFIYILMPMRSK